MPLCPQRALQPEGALAQGEALCPGRCGPGNWVGPGSMWASGRRLAFKGPAHSQLGHWHPLLPSGLTGTSLAPRVLPTPLASHHHRDKVTLSPQPPCWACQLQGPVDGAEGTVPTLRAAADTRPQTGPCSGHFSKHRLQPDWSAWRLFWRPYHAASLPSQACLGLCTRFFRVPTASGFCTAFPSPKPAAAWPLSRGPGAAT